ncbi:LuxR family transcriptional regulator [Rhodococcus pseudokoreensis]|uniref:LuxR family transcriptional regulator n=1 Tax=Rhodococcus pseudokoreensis TaxID=2811421 RepID=A0A974W6X0_9NOCA|nr:LuxR C-terminal-related transcriptional regulator [Rhodococcus pseudokoreensis]QSE92310.1 LuxR family transcriptional regulator [Rhodococcus pseudokoreensis]
MRNSSSRQNGAAVQDAVAAIAHDVGVLLDRDLSAPQPTGACSDRQTLGRLWDLVTAEMLRAIGDRGSSSDVLTSLTEMLGRIREAEAAVARWGPTDPAEVLARVQSALARVGDAQTVDALLARAPEAVCSLGFDRALLSTVDGAWRLHSMHVVRDPRWAEEIVAVGRENPPVLDRTLVENDTVTGARATLVHEVQDNPRVNRPLAEITKSSSYGIAPLVVEGDVVGLVHGDCYHQQRNLTAVDQALLSTFAEGMSQNLSRVTVLEGLTAVRTQLDGLGRWNKATAPGVAKSVALGRDDDSVLTRREVQIVRLMADGDSNGRIARRLVISEGTVKTHITRILRKLGASNRAEAVSIWLRNADRTHTAPQG